MTTLGIAISFSVFLLDGLLVLRGGANRLSRLFPVFYAYLIYVFGGFLVGYLVLWFRPGKYPSMFWIYYLVTILVEFSVLVEISNHIFQPFPALRNLGCALTIAISIGLGLVYILPAILWSMQRSNALIDFTLRASVTKAIILAVLFYAARHYGSELGRNVSGLMLGFSIYLAMNIGMMAAAKAFGPGLATKILWIMSPLGTALCTMVWAVSLWNIELAPVPGAAQVTHEDSEALTLELLRYNGTLSKIVHK
jgi:hypothetical protein